MLYFSSSASFTYTSISEAVQLLAWMCSNSPKWIPFIPQTKYRLYLLVLEVAWGVGAFWQLTAVHSVVLNVMLWADWARYSVGVSIKDLGLVVDLIILKVKYRVRFEISRAAVNLLWVLLLCPFFYSILLSLLFLYHLCVLFVCKLLVIGNCWSIAVEIWIASPILMELMLSQ